MPPPKRMRRTGEAEAGPSTAPDYIPPKGAEDDPDWNPESETESEQESVEEQQAEEGMDDDNASVETEGDEKHEFERGPGGDEWTCDPKMLACPCGILVKKGRVKEHIKCTKEVTPLMLMHKAQSKHLATMVRKGAKRQAKCPACEKPIKASERDVSVQKAIARHFDKCHKGLNKEERKTMREQIFGEGHVLVATNIETAISLKVPLEERKYRAMMHERQRHGSNHA